MNAVGVTAESITEGKLPSLEWEAFSRGAVSSRPVDALFPRH